MLSSSVVDLESLDRLETQFDLLRARLLRLARALIVLEDHHADVLLRLSNNHAAAAVHTLVDGAHIARTNADRATTIVTEAERMRNPRADATARDRQAQSAD
jgi:hypothetical protein